MLRAFVLFESTCSRRARVASTVLTAIDGHGCGGEPSSAGPFCQDRPEFSGRPPVVGASRCRGGSHAALASDTRAIWPPVRREWPFRDRFGADFGPKRGVRPENRNQRPDREVPPGGTDGLSCEYRIRKRRSRNGWRSGFPRWPSRFQETTGPSRVFREVADAARLFPTSHGRTDEKRQMTCTLRSFGPDMSAPIGGPDRIACDQPALIGPNPYRL